MLEKISRFFDSHIAFNDAEEHLEEKLRVASIALLLEMLLIDKQASTLEINSFMSILKEAFLLTETQTNALFEIAENRVEKATDYYEFTHLINQQFSHDRKLLLVESLWQVALIDGQLDIEEEYLIEKIARLLYIPHIEVFLTGERVKKTRITIAKTKTHFLIENSLV